MAEHLAVASGSAAGGTATGRWACLRGRAPRALVALEGPSPSGGRRHRGPRMARGQRWSGGARPPSPGGIRQPWPVAPGGSVTSRAGGSFNDLRVRLDFGTEEAHASIQEGQVRRLACRGRPPSAAGTPSPNATSSQPGGGIVRGKARQMLSFREPVRVRRPGSQKCLDGSPGRAREYLRGGIPGHNKALLSAHRI